MEGVDDERKAIRLNEGADVIVSCTTQVFELGKWLLSRVKLPVPHVQPGSQIRS
jgi:hypothetical protein